MKDKVYNIIVTAILMICLGVALLSYNYIKKKKEEAYEKMTYSIFTEVELEEAPKDIEESTIEQEEIEEEKNIKKEETKKTNKTKQQEKYIGMLEIPKINLKKVFYDKKSANNTIEKNVTVVEASQYPDVKNGNLILAAHSGSSYKSFFNNLVKLNKKDKAHIYYKNKKYIYEIVNIYKQPRIGKINVYRNYTKNTLTLVTCTRTDNTTQTIYIAELVKIE